MVLIGFDFYPSISLGFFPSVHWFIMCSVFSPFGLGFLLFFLCDSSGVRDILRLTVAICSPPFLMDDVDHFRFFSGSQ